jgi:hypothetical protein
MRILHLLPPPLLQVSLSFRSLETRENSAEL